MTGLAGAVKLDGGNAAGDVAELQRLLNLRTAALGIGALRTDGVLDPDTKRALASYAVRLLGRSAPATVAPGDAVATALADVTPSALMREGARGREARARMSGADWAGRAAAFADSRDPADLAPLVAVRAARWLRALSAAGARVNVEATKRDPVRAWLIRSARAVAAGALAPGEVMPEQQAPVIWDHGDLDRSRKAAAEMAKAFGTDQPPPEGSPHFDGHVLSMTVGWAGPIALVDGYGATHRLEPPQGGAPVPELRAIAASYGLRASKDDPRDWIGAEH